MNTNDSIDWNEFMVFVKWAINEYGHEIHDADECLEIAFRKGIIPVMREELLE